MSYITTVTRANGTITVEGKYDDLQSAQDEAFTSATEGTPTTVWQIVGTAEPSRTAEWKPVLIPVQGV